MIKKLLIPLFIGLYALTAAAQDHPFQKMVFERLPSLETPRGVGQPVLLGDEVTVFGGHTTGYKPAETAEYYSGGAWHSIPMTYPHDGGSVTRLPDGRIFLAGGNAESFGIGQSWGAEIYDPATHSFTPIGIMDRKRSLCCALALPDGRVLIAGNWHGPDGMEQYTPGAGFSRLKDLEPGLTYPYILQSAKDDFLVFSQMDSYGDTLGAYVRRLKGEPLYVPLLEEWHPIFNTTTRDDELRIADYTYLLLATLGRQAFTIIKVSGESFSLLPLEIEIPTKGPAGERIFWDVGPQVDRSGRLAWIQGKDRHGRLYFAKIGYNPTFDGGKASVELYYAETMEGEGFPSGKALLLPGGDFFLAGGLGRAPSETDIVDDNFKTFSDVYLFHTEEPEKAGIPLWVKGLAFLLLCFAVVFLGSYLRRKKTPVEVPVEPAQKLNADLMAEMERLIGEKKLFLRKDLRVADIAQEMATNETYVSLLINNLSGNNFATLIGGYRVRHAQQLMREHPEMVHADVAEASGFASRTAFLRTFKAQTGLTPTEWKRREGI